MSALSGDRRRLAAARAVHRARGAHRTRADTAYVIYLGALVAAIAGVPVVRTIVLALATPAAMQALRHESIVRVIAVIAALVWFAALMIGSSRGPIVPTPFVAAVRGRSDIAPQAAWAHNIAGAAIGTTLLFGGLAALSVGGFLAHGENVDISGAFIIGAALFALPTTAIWLAGQVLSRRGAIIVGGLLALLVGAAAFGPPAVSSLPASALSGLWPGAAGSGSIGLIVLAIFAAVALALIVALLRRISPGVVEDHALRWEAMTVLAATGDISGALDRTRARPSVGRRMRIPFSRPLVLAVFQRASIGVMRTPLRAIIALIGLVVAGSGWAWFAQIEHGPRWAAALGVGLLTFAALGAFSDGFQDAADTAGRPALYGRAPGRMLMLHLPLPLLAGVILPSVTVIATGSSLLTAAMTATVSAVLVAVRAYHATKGAMPVELMMPIPTPVGDASSIGMWAWQADALLWTAALTLLLSTAATSGAVMLWWAIPLIGLLAALTAGRLRRAAS